MDRIEDFGDAERVRQFPVRWVLQHLLAAQDDDRQGIAVDVEGLQSPLRVRIAADVEEAVRVAVAGEEALDPERTGGACLTNDDRSALGVLDQVDATQDEGAQDDLRNVGLRTDHPAEGVPGHPNDRRRSRGAGTDQDRPSRHMVEFSGERAWNMGRDEDMPTLAIAAHDIDRAVEHDEEVDAPVSDVIQVLATVERMAFAIPCNPLDHRGRQPREGLCRPLTWIGG